MHPTIKIDLIAGARPNFIKIAPLIEEINTACKNGYKIKYRLIHTGQHFDKNMSENFFNQLNIPDPDFNFGSGGGTQAEQTAKIMVEYEKILKNVTVDYCLVVGDVTSTMACSIVAKKENIKVIHVEGGIRSWDISMPEEINRIITDSISDYFFTTSKTANKNLLDQGISKNRIFFVGNTMIDTLLKYKKKFRKPKLWAKIGLKKSKYFVMTLHRPSNVDEEKKLFSILFEIVSQAKDMPIIFPVHPRTKMVQKNILKKESKYILKKQFLLLRILNFQKPMM